MSDSNAYAHGIRAARVTPPIQYSRPHTTASGAMVNAATSSSTLRSRVSASSLASAPIDSSRLSSPSIGRS